MDSKRIKEKQHHAKQYFVIAGAAFLGAVIDNV